MGVALVVPTALSVNCALFDGPELDVDGLWSLELAGCWVTGADFVVALVVTIKFGSCVGWGQTETDCKFSVSIEWFFIYLLRVVVLSFLLNRWMCMDLSRKADC